MKACGLCKHSICISLHIKQTSKWNLDFTITCENHKKYYKYPYKYSQVFIISPIYTFIILSSIYTFSPILPFSPMTQTCLAVDAIE